MDNRPVYAPIITIKITRKVNVKAASLYATQTTRGEDV
jgi:hypothetical protein